ncbi:DUF1684 domain-containing protein [Pontibacter cellulosilyticus]|uniref:DUF1684 domain-containing protein n=1 Tax=Pontibacter cellulosilyticus TaxID=1720253 RepID=A0A923NA07_9BACT|nr:DUF1684 domain-containing protein [Pontibacter cellulosilyticus]MBC5993632.1 DUF1684 domain-containing protein [Pontibacter cellulosilyticus]
MINKITTVFLSATALVFTACTSTPEVSEADRAANAAYVASINEWHKEREASLKSEEGWLALAGLFWLNEGKNTFGSAEINDFVFPEGKIAAEAGAFILSGDEVRLEVKDTTAILVNEELVKQAVVFGLEMQQAPVMKYGPLSWFVIKRGDKYGVRLRDSKSEARQHFKGIERYNVTANWKLEAKLEPSPFPKQIAITNVLGQTSQEASPGTLVFKVDGQEHRLDALAEGNKLFIIFADKTNRTETYGAGRYLYADKPGADGTVILDFNRATNPPCAFVPYATCPLPPKQNFLTIPVPAGEKAYKAGHE